MLAGFILMVDPLLAPWTWCSCQQPGIQCASRFLGEVIQNFWLHGRTEKMLTTGWDPWWDSGWELHHGPNLSRSLGWQASYAFEMLVHCQFETSLTMWCSPSCKCQRAARSSVQKSCNFVEGGSSAWLYSFLNTQKKKHGGSRPVVHLNRTVEPATRLLMLWCDSWSRQAPLGSRGSTDMECNHVSQVQHHPLHCHFPISCKASCTTWGAMQWHVS